MTGTAQMTIANQAAYVMGAAALSSPNNSIFDFRSHDNNSMVQLNVDNLAHPQVVYWDGSGSHTVTAPTTIASPSAYHYFELKVTNAGTGAANGTITVHIDGVHWTSLDVSSVTLEDSFSHVSQIYAARLAGGGVTYDDFYVCDLTGGQNNDFLGPISVYALWATANGNTNQWTAVQTPNTGANAYKNVNETTPDGDTSYNATSTVGNIEDYAFSNASIPASQSLLGVIAMAVVRDDLAGAAQVAPYLEQAASNNVGTAVGVSTSYIGVAGVYDSNPNTSAAWVMSDINSLSAGLKRTA